jgi:muramoyltetrapeptide carboxypeptidase
VSFLRPPALKAGDAVAVAATAGPFDPESFRAGLEVLARRYQPEHGPGLFEQHRYLAGTDQRRFAELDGALRGPAKAVFAARGGYGTMRLLAQLPFEKFTPKPLVGFSDLTALHAAFNGRGWVTIHGPVLTQLGKLNSGETERLFHLLESPDPAPPLHGTQALVDGIAEGPLLGGNLSVLTRLLGTPFLPPLKGAVLLLEDIGERPYKLDRMWTHLSLAGVFDQISGIVWGELTGCEEKGVSYTAAEVIAELAAQVGLPCASGFPIGHGSVNQPVPLGARVRLDAGKRELSFLEAAVAR